MTNPCDLELALNDFSGFAPLFPLPNVVLFPHALLPLQIFEPRYRQMTADALEGERLIAMCLMRPGWQYVSAYAATPVHHMVGLGQIVAHEKLDDGRYFLVVRGLVRAKIKSEKLVELPYRIGQLEICADVLEQQSYFNRRDRVEELCRLYAQLFPGVNLQQLFLQAVNDLPLATICDVLLGSIPLVSEVLQRFLDELNVDTRSQMLLDLLSSGALQGATPTQDTISLHRSFPPGFSAN